MKLKKLPTLILSMSMFICPTILNGVSIVEAQQIGEEQVQGSALQENQEGAYTDQYGGVVNIADWKYTNEGGRITISDYIGNEKHVVVPASGDFGESGITEVALMANLVKKVIDNNSVLESFSVSKNGSKVKLATSPGDTGADYRIGRGKEAIKYLDLSGLDYTGFNGFFAVVTLEHLKVANLTGMVYEDVVVGNLQQNPELETLILRDATIKGSNLYAFARDCPKLATIDALGLKITGGEVDAGDFLKTSTVKPITILTDNDHLMNNNIDYAAHNRVPSGTVNGNSNATFADGQETKTLFDEVWTSDGDSLEDAFEKQLARRAEELQIAPGYVFKEWTPAENYQTIAEKITGTYTAVVEQVPEAEAVIEANDSEITVGDTWQASDNFVSATAKDGTQTTDINDVKVSGTVDTNKAGVYPITYEYDGATKTINVTVKEKAPDSDVEKVDLTSVYRLRNSKSYERLYTIDENEKNNLTVKHANLGWYEEKSPNSSLNLKVLKTKPENGKQFYRLKNVKSGEHLFTADENEVKVLTTKYGWTIERNINMYVYGESGKPKDAKRIYRLRNTKSGERVYTVDENEKKVLTTRYAHLGWIEEGQAASSRMYTLKK